MSPDPYARYPSKTFAVLPDGLLAVLVEKSVGRNGWAVLVALCHGVFANGRLARMSAKSVSEVTGLNEYQIARGMAELRSKEIIVPVMRKNKDGYRHPDRSNLRHVAQYTFTREVWERIACEEASEIG